jgi:hypothetical protein
VRLGAICAERCARRLVDECGCISPSGEIRMCLPAQNTHLCTDPEAVVVYAADMQAFTANKLSLETNFYNAENMCLIATTGYTECA